MLTTRCVRCSGEQLQLGALSDGAAIEFRRTKSSTGFVITAWCVYCDRPARPGWFDAKAHFSEQEMLAMPWLKSARGKENCGICGVAADLETHHLAPRALFGEEAERWPTVDVCRSCHER